VRMQRLNFLLQDVKAIAQEAVAEQRLVHTCTETGRGKWQHGEVFGTMKWQYAARYNPIALALRSRLDPTGCAISHTKQNRSATLWLCKLHPRMLHPRLHTLLKSHHAHTHCKAPVPGLAPLPAAHLAALPAGCASCWGRAAPCQASASAVCWRHPSPAGHGSCAALQGPAGCPHAWQQPSTCRNRRGSDAG
jgi:hypothetical protein